MSQAIASPEQADAYAAISSVFWSTLSDDSSSDFASEDRNLLKGIFNTHLSDRSKDGDRFVPPDPSSEYMQSLRDLVQAEDAMRQRRRDYFFSAEFSMDATGPLFPSSWNVSFEIVRGQKQGGCALLARPEYKA